MKLFRTHRYQNKGVATARKLWAECENNEKIFEKYKYLKGPWSKFEIEEPATTQYLSGDHLKPRLRGSRIETATWTFPPSVDTYCCK